MTRYQVPRAMATGFARAALRGKAVILTYHRVLPPEQLRTNTIDWRMGVSTDAFAGHARWLRDHVEVVDEDGFRDRLSGRVSAGRKPSVLITFDDGWYDNLEHAVPILRRHGLPATIYLCTENVETGEPFWWTVVEAAGHRLGARGVADRLRALGVSVPEEAETTGAVIAYLKHVSGPELVRIVRSLRSDTSLDRQALTWSEVDELGADGDVTFGPHTKAHSILPVLTDEAIDEEIGGSARAVRERPVRQSRFFCFPNGDYDERCVAAVRRAGFERGLALGQRAFRARTAGSILPRVNLGMHNAPDAAGLALTLAKAGLRPTRRAA